MGLDMTCVSLSGGRPQIWFSDNRNPVRTAPAADPLLGHHGYSTPQMLGGQEVAPGRGDIGAGIAVGLGHSPEEAAEAIQVLGAACAGGPTGEEDEVHPM